MVAQPRRGFGDGFKFFVPGMQYASDLQLGFPTLFSLGTPAAASATGVKSGIDADAVATTEETLSYEAAEPYGRTLTLTPSGNPGNSFAIDIYGYDYLGQPMVERFTGASGSTAAIYGKKAFKRAVKSKIVTAASNAITANCGTGLRLGLPYKGDVEWAKENGVYVPVYTRDYTLWADRAAAQAVSGGSNFLRAPSPGYVKTLLGIPNGGGSTTDPVITVELATVAITGLTVTIDTSNASGLLVTDTPTTPGYNGNNRFVAGDMIEIVGAAAASAGSDSVGVEITPTQFIPGDTTDPGTVSTGDPRGTYEALATYNGSIEIVVGLRGDPSVNAAGNGGLHGIQHYIA